ncbi:uncharacterized protein METZ01_LOCUS164566 [marine metagenome]|uniref:Uncharacterized protein n=1 Tax=marine metagenome TaxID=408172 RepID=A0A382BEM3_9ZZZZ
MRQPWSRLIPKSTRIGMLLTLWRRMMLTRAVHNLTVVLLLKKSRTDRVWMRMKQRHHRSIAVRN